jgi:hypothetical protein
MANFTGSLIPIAFDAGTYAVPTGVLVPPPLNVTAPAPTVTFIDPIPPNLPSPGRAITLQVTDTDGFASICTLAEYGTGAYEVVHDGDKFGQVYAAQSTRTTITNGFEYIIKRAGGWFGDTVTVRVIAVDSGGEVG